MKKIVLRLSACLLFSIGLNSQALVNPITQSLSFSHADGDFKGVHILRSYHSDRQTIGSFGVGFCAWWESKLKIVKGEVHFNYCGTGSSTVFSGSATDFSSTQPGQKLSFNKTNEFVLEFSDRSKMTFDKEGNLKKLDHPDYQFDLTYEASKVKNIIDKKKSLKLDLAYNPKGLLISMTGPQTRILYDYDQASRLRQVKSHQGKEPLWVYNWTKANQIESVLEGKKPWVNKVSYGSNKKVTSINTGACQEHLRLTRGTRVSQLQVNKVCAGGYKNTRNYRIQSGTDSGTFSLTELEKAKDVSSKVMVNGFAIKEVSKAGSIERSFDAQGRLKSLVTNGTMVDIVKRNGFSYVEQIKIAPTTGRGPASEGKLMWRGPELVHFTIGNQATAVRRSAHGIEFVSKDFQVKGEKKNGGQWISGKLKKKRVPPFNPNSPVMELNPVQLEAMGIYAHQLDTLNALESL